MAVLGDRAVAGLLSALAEAPDSQEAAAFLVAQLGVLTAAPRGCMLRLDPSRERLVVVASSGFSPEPSSLSVSIGDLASPIVVGTLALVPVHGKTPLAQRQFVGMK